MTRGSPARRVAERVGAGLVGVVDLFVSIPDIPTGVTVPAGRSIWSPLEPAFWVAATYVAAVVGLILAIWIGQSRSRALRLIGWAGLSAWLILKMT